MPFLFQLLYYRSLHATKGVAQADFLLMLTEYDPAPEIAVASLLTKCVYDKQTHKRGLKV